MIREYKRFLYLAASSPLPVTPSEDVDEAWHLHLAYSRHYWETLCGQILCRPLHHGPTAGGEAEGDRYRRQYEETLARYRGVFGEEPPKHIWPPAVIRFQGSRRRVDASRYWLVPRVRVRLASAAIAGGMLVAACAAAGEGGDGGTLIFGAVIFAVIAGIFVGRFYSQRAGKAGWIPHRRARRDGSGSDHGPIFIADAGRGNCKAGAASDCGDGGGGDGGGGCGGGGCGS